MLKKKAIQDFRFKVADKISDFPQQVYSFHDKFPDGAPKKIAAMGGSVSLAFLCIPFFLCLLLFCLVADTLNAIAQDD